jgi:hypothetical protein
MQVRCLRLAPQDFDDPPQDHVAGVVGREPLGAPEQLRQQGSRQVAMSAMTDHGTAAARQTTRVLRRSP